MRHRALLVALLACLSVPAGAHGAAYAPAPGQVFHSGIGGYDANAVGDFTAQSGKHPAIFQYFISWRSAPSDVRFVERLLQNSDRARSRAALAVSTKGTGLSPAALAAGEGDGFLLAMNHVLAAHGRPTYLGLLSEMNNANNPTRPSGLRSRSATISRPRSSPSSGSRPIRVHVPCYAGCFARRATWRSRRNIASRFLVFGAARRGRALAMSTEPQPLTLAEAVRRAVQACDPAGEDPSAAEVLVRFEDRDEPIAALQDLDGRLAEEFGALDPQEEDPLVQMIRATTLYLAFKRPEVRAGDVELLRLAARAEYSGAPPEPVRSWLAERGVDP